MTIRKHPFSKKFKKNWTFSQELQKKSTNDHSQASIFQKVQKKIGPFPKSCKKNQLMTIRTLRFSKK